MLFSYSLDRTDTEYDDALIGKLFAFSFINSYASLFFIAFVKSNLGEACQGPCMVELAYQLFILLSKIHLSRPRLSSYQFLFISNKDDHRESNKLCYIKSQSIYYSIQ